MPRPRPAPGSKLSLPHKKFVEEFVKSDGQIAKSYKQAYPNVKDNSARVAGNRLLHDVNIQRSIIEHMNKAGITDERLVDKLSSMIDARKEVVTNDGSIVDVVDNTTQMSALNTSLKLRGHLQEQGVVNIHIGTSVQTPAELAKLERIINKANEMMIECGLIKAKAQEAQVVEVASGDGVGGVDELASLSASA